MVRHPEAGVFPIHTFIRLEQVKIFPVIFPYAIMNYRFSIEIYEIFYLK